MTMACKYFQILFYVSAVALWGIVASGEQEAVVVEVDGTLSRQSLGRRSSSLLPQKPQKLIQQVPNLERQLSSESHGRSQYEKYSPYEAYYPRGNGKGSGKGGRGRESRSESSDGSGKGRGSKNKSQNSSGKGKGSRSKSSKSESGKGRHSSSQDHDDEDEEEGGIPLRLLLLDGTCLKGAFAG